MNDLKDLPDAHEARREVGADLELKLGSSTELNLKLLRPSVRGKFLFLGDEKFWIKGVTYGTFRPDADGHNFPAHSMVRADLAMMSRAGLNCIRVYTVPPRWFLELAQNYGLRVMVGLPWEQHIAFLEDPSTRRRIKANLRDAVRQCAGHPAVLCYAVGNEIPASVVRWYGRRRIAAFLRGLAEIIRSEDPGSLVTYVNFPTTEYLELDFLDFVSFNVYLETKETLASYLARLQNLAGDRPLLMAEVGLDSRRNGEETQADKLSWQIETTFEGGCIGAFIFAWTDEWHRGGFDIEDWDFGLTTRDRKDKLALARVSQTFADAPFFKRAWPKISVVVCSYNGSMTIGETLVGLEHLNYPDYEIIVIDDGSIDNVSLIAQAHRVHLIRQENQGLSAARNTGLAAASGDIVAYVDDDAYPDIDWLRYLAMAFEKSSHAAIGGPNLSPWHDGHIADCVANAPGGPVHVLLTDTVAEHIPGCNMAFRRECLLSVGGFDPRFRVAGDDVDACWRLQQRGRTIGYSPVALVWHHRRPSVIRYLSQQRGYAKAEALLAEKWPEKYNRFGHLAWEGRLYGRGNLRCLLPRPRIYHGTWGSALFQSVYQPSPGNLLSFSLMPEWYGLLLLLGLGTGLGLSWPPLLALLPLFLAGLGLTLAQAIQGAATAEFKSSCYTPRFIGILKIVVGALHLLQPAARLIGRIQHGLGPWGTKHGKHQPPRALSSALWFEQWAAIEARLAAIERLLQQGGVVVVRGGDFDDWDFVLRSGISGSVKVRSMVEEHGAGKQLLRLSARPQVPAVGMLIITVLVVVAGMAFVDGAWPAAVAMSMVASGLAYIVYCDCGVAMRSWSEALSAYSEARGGKNIQDDTIRELDFR